MKENVASVCGTTLKKIQDIYVHARTPAQIRTLYFHIIYRFLIENLKMKSLSR